LRFVDFDGDGKADVFTTWGGKWRVSEGKSDWEVINTSSAGVADLNVGNFNGDKSDGIAVRNCLRIARFTTTSLDDAEADAILAKASSAIETSDGPDDVACSVEFTRAGPVTGFRTGDGSIDSRAEFVRLAI